MADYREQARGDFEMSKILPILFNTEMVQAILAGRKTCTRRAVKRAIPFDSEGKSWSVLIKGEWSGLIGVDDFVEHYTPYHPGDILYVRETWHKYTKRVEKGESCHLQEFYGYKASVGNSEDASEPWKPSIHMPKEAARIFLRITGIRLERLQEITEDEAKAEGANWKNGKNVGVEEKMSQTAVERFAKIWDSTIKNPIRSPRCWDINPYVWVIEFERCEKPEGWLND